MRVAIHSSSFARLSIEILIKDFITLSAQSSRHTSNLTMTDVSYAFSLLGLANLIELVNKKKKPNKQIFFSQLVFISWWFYRRMYRIDWLCKIS